MLDWKKIKVIFVSKLIFVVIFSPSEKTIYCFFILIFILFYLFSIGLMCAGLISQLGCQSLRHDTISYSVVFFGMVVTR